MRTCVLIAEDDALQAEVLRRYLEQDGHLVLQAADGAQAVALARARRPDLVVLDLMLPTIDGLEVCRTLRRESPVAILMLTARAREEDLLLGLDMGADDYVTKPYSPRELVARVRTLLRRTGRMAVVEDHSLRVGELVLDLGRHEVTLAGRPVSCTTGEFTMLTVLARRPWAGLQPPAAARAHPRHRPFHHRAVHRRAGHEPAPQAGA